MKHNLAIAQARPSNRRERRKAEKQQKRQHAGHGRAAPSSAKHKTLEDITVSFNDEASIERGKTRLIEAIEKDPDNARAHMLLGVIYSQLEDYDAAYPHLKKAASLDPEDARIWANFAGCLYNLNHFEAAAIAAQKATARAPDNPNMLLLLGRTLSACERSDEALVAINKAVELEPDYSQAHYFSGQIHRSRGDFGKAREAYMRAVSYEPTLTGAYFELSTLDNTPKQARDLLKRMEPLRNDTGLNTERRKSLFFAIAFLRNRLKDYDAAFAAYSEANAVAKSSISAHSQDFFMQVSDTIEGFQPETFDRLKDAASDDATPVFIVGMPRSGTTLVEQIISSHPQVHAGGELPRLQKIVSILLGSRDGKYIYPKDAANITPDAYKSLGEDYLEHLRMNAPEASGRITDKLPFNYLNLGLIAAMFPNATILHCRRDPMDTCLSCYFQNFNKLGNIWFAHDLEDLGRYYRGYEELMAHWHDVLPIPILDVHYEELIADQETVSRAIIAHAGLEWDDACLEFHKNERAVSTASVWQVRQPVYKTSMQRWKCYEKHLDPLKKALAGQA